MNSDSRAGQSSASPPIFIFPSRIRFLDQNAVFVPVGDYQQKPTRPETLRTGRVRLYRPSLLAVLRLAQVLPPSYLVRSGARFRHSAFRRLGGQQRTATSKSSGQ